MFYRNFVPFWDIRLQKCHDLENWVRSPSRWLEMSPCDRVHKTSYWRSIVNMALFRVISEIFSVEKCCDLEIGSEVTQGHWKLYLSIDCIWFLLVFFSNYVPEMHRFWDFRLVSIQRPWNPGLGSLKVIENDTIWSGTHDFLLTFHSSHQPI